MTRLRLPHSGWLCTAALLLLVVACNSSDTTSPSPAVVRTVPANASSANLLALTGRIAFVSNRAGNPGIYVMNPDGSGVARLTRNSTDGQPAWSRDGTKIAFVRGSGLSAEIYVMKANGTGVTRLTNNGVIDETPAWSPDGTKIAFVSTRQSTYRQLYVMKADGSGVTRLTQNTAVEFYPAWSPDGTKIAFEHHWHTIINRQIVFRVDIARIPAGGGGAILITQTGHEYHPAWSPDGTKIVFSSTRDGLFHNNTPARELYRMNADGSSVIRLTNNGVNDDWATWSPDASKIAFASDRSGPVEIYRMNPNGSGVTRLTSNTSTNSQPAWGP